MAETEIKVLKETLHAQQQLLQKLYIELDEERESSATAAEEALSMILRLQGQKAVVEMEASQYKRMTEEKMYHSEESLAIFEDLYYQKEMEIAALEFQVQAYRYKLLSMGVGVDLGVGETIFPDNMLSQRNEAAYGGDAGGQGHGNGSIRRNNSLPPISLKGASRKRGVFERERSPSPLVNMISRIEEENIDKESNVQKADSEKNFEAGTFESYWEQIRKLDDRVKEISDCKDSGKERKSPNSNERSTSKPPLVSRVRRASSLCNPKVEHPPENLLDNEVIVTSVCTLGVQDIFEVPEITKDSKSCGKRKIEQDEWNSEGENNRLGKPDPILPLESVKSHIEDESNFARKMLQCTNNEIYKPRERDGVPVDHNLTRRHSMGVSETEIQQLTKRVERLENERRSARQEIISEEGEREEELKLLKEMREQLNSIQSEIRSWRTKKSPPPNDAPLLSLMESMLHFWL